MLSDETQLCKAKAIIKLPDLISASFNITSGNMFMVFFAFSFCFLSFFEPDLKKAFNIPTLMMSF